MTLSMHTSWHVLYLYCECQFSVPCCPQGHRSVSPPTRQRPMYQLHYMAQMCDTVNQVFVSEIPMKCCQCGLKGGNFNSTALERVNFVFCAYCNFVLCRRCLRATFTTRRRSTKFSGNAASCLSRITSDASQKFVHFCVTRRTDVEYFSFKFNCCILLSSDMSAQRIVGFCGSPPGRWNGLLRWFGHFERKDYADWVDFFRYVVDCQGGYERFSSPQKDAQFWNSWRRNIGGGGP